jgi:serine/threonine protein phosphatase PrpC
MGMRIPDGIALTLKGVAAVIADGVSSAEAGREASESCAQSFLADYYSTPDSWTVKTSGQAVLTALNCWLYNRGHGIAAAHRGYVSTFSALIVKSRTAHLFHVGDTRIYRIRDGTLECLTRDHVTRISEHETCLGRAIGMDVKLQVDYRSVDVRTGDVFLLTSHGIHDSLDARSMNDIIRAGLARADDFGPLCDDLIGVARVSGSSDNLTAQLLRVDALPPDDVDAMHRRLTQLPFAPALEQGMTMDGLRIEKEIHASSRSQLYLVTRVTDGERLVMKTPSVNFEDDPAYIERFVMEPWIGKRVADDHVVRISETSGAQSCLDYLMEFVDGPSLRQWIDERPQHDIPEIVDAIEQIASGLRSFHRREALHQDPKPENVVFTRDSVAKIVDFGSCHVAGVQEIATPIERDLALGTANYCAPETRLGENAGVRSDLFSLGTLAYEMLTGALPYGESIASAKTSVAFERLAYTPSYHHNPMVPRWMDGALKAAVAIPPRRRYSELSEFVYDLRRPNAAHLDERPRPLIERDPLRFWRGLSALLAGAWAATLWLSR